MIGSEQLHKPRDGVISLHFEIMQNDSKQIVGFQVSTDNSQMFYVKINSPIPAKTNAGFDVSLKHDNCWATAMLLLHEMVIFLHDSQILLQPHSLRARIEELSKNNNKPWHLIYHPQQNYSTTFQDKLLPKLRKIESVAGSQQLNRMVSISMIPLKIFNVMSGNLGFPSCKMPQQPPVLWDPAVRSQMQKLFHLLQGFQNSSPIDNRLQQSLVMKGPAYSTIGGTIKQIEYTANQRQILQNEQVSRIPDYSRSAILTSGLNNTFGRGEESQNSNQGNLHKRNLNPFESQTNLLKPTNQQSEKNVKNPFESQIDLLKPTNQQFEKKPKNPFEDSDESIGGKKDETPTGAHHKGNSFNPFLSSARNSIANLPPPKLDLQSLPTLPTQQPQSSRSKAETGFSSQSGLNKLIPEPQPVIYNPFLDVDEPQVHQTSHHFFDTRRNQAQIMVPSPASSIANSLQSSQHSEYGMGSIQSAGLNLTPGVARHPMNMMESTNSRSPVPTITQQLNLSQRLPQASQPRPQVQQISASPSQFELSDLVHDLQLPNGRCSTMFEKNPEAIFKMIVFKQPPKAEDLKVIFKKLVESDQERKSNQSSPLWNYVAAKLFEKYPKKVIDFCEHMEEATADASNILPGFPAVFSNWVERISQLFKSDPQHLMIPIIFLQNFGSKESSPQSQQIATTLDIIFTKFKASIPSDVAKIKDHQSLYCKLIVNSFALPNLQLASLESFEKKLDSLAKEDFKGLLRVMITEAPTSDDSRIDSYCTRIFTKLITNGIWKDTEIFIIYLATKHKPSSLQSEQDSPPSDEVCLLLRFVETFKCNRSSFLEFKKKLIDLIFDAIGLFTNRKLKVGQLFKFQLELDFKLLITALVAANAELGPRGRRANLEKELKDQIKHIEEQREPLECINSALKILNPFFLKHRVSLLKSDWTPLLNHLDQVELKSVEPLLYKKEFLAVLEQVSSLLSISFIQSKFEAEIKNSGRGAYQVINKNFETLLQGFWAECISYTTDFKNLMNLDQVKFSRWSQDLRTSKQTFEKLYQICGQTGLTALKPRTDPGHMENCSLAWKEYLKKGFEQTRATVREALLILEQKLLGFKLEEEVKRVLDTVQISSTQAEQICVFLIHQAQNLTNLARGLELVEVFTTKLKSNPDKTYSTENIKNMLINLLVDGDLAFFSVTESEINTIEFMIEVRLNSQVRQQSHKRPELMGLIQNILINLGDKERRGANLMENLSFPNLAGVDELYYSGGEGPINIIATQLLNELHQNSINIKRCIDIFLDSTESYEKNKAKKILDGSWIIFKLDSRAGEYHIFCTSKEEDIQICLSSTLETLVVKDAYPTIMGINQLDDIRVKLTISSLDDNEKGALRELKIPYTELMRLAKEIQTELSQIHMSGSIYDLNSCLRQAIQREKFDMEKLKIFEQDFNVAIFIKAQPESQYLETGEADSSWFQSLNVLLTCLTNLTNGSIKDSLSNSKLVEPVACSSRLRQHLTNKQKRFLCNYIIKKTEEHTPQAPRMSRKTIEATEAEKIDADRSRKEFQQWKSLLCFAGEEKYRRLIDCDFSDLKIEDVRSHYKSDTIIDLIARKYGKESLAATESHSGDIKGKPLYGAYNHSSLEALLSFIAKRQNIVIQENVQPRYFLFLNNELTSYDLESFLVRAFTDVEKHFYFMLDYHLISLEKRHHLLGCLNRFKSKDFCPEGFNSNLLILLPKEHDEKVWQEISMNTAIVGINPEELRTTVLTTTQENQRFKDLLQMMRTTVVQSEYGGMGKSYWIESKCASSQIVKLHLSGEANKAALDNRLEILEEAMLKIEPSNSTADRPLVLHLKLDMMDNMLHNLELLNQFLIQLCLLNIAPYKYGYLDLKRVSHVYLEIGNSYKEIILRKLPIVKIQPKENFEMISKLKFFEWAEIGFNINDMELQRSIRTLTKGIKVTHPSFSKFNALELFAMFWKAFNNNDLTRYTMTQLLRMGQGYQTSKISSKDLLIAIREYINDRRFGTEQVNSMTQVQAILKILTYQLSGFEDLLALDPNFYSTEAYDKHYRVAKSELEKFYLQVQKSRKYLLEFIFKNSKSFACSTSTDLRREKQHAILIESKQKFMMASDAIALEEKQACEKLLQDYKELVKNLPTWGKDERTKIAVFMMKGSFGIVYQDFEEVSPHLKSLVYMVTNEEMKDINAYIQGNQQGLNNQIIIQLIRGLDLTRLYLPENSKNPNNSNDPKNLNNPPTDAPQTSSKDFDIEAHARKQILKEASSFKSKGYVLTNDNYLKIMMIAQRAEVSLPVVIMGATGCGKTYMIEFISKCLLQDEFYCINMNPGVTETELIAECQTFISQAKTLAAGKRLWVLFDEFNTSPLQNLVQEIICSRFCSFTPLISGIPDNIVFVAACNPYRIEPNTSQTGLIHESSQSNLAHRVYPIPDTLLNFIWDFGQLGEETEKQYIYSILGARLQSRKQEDNRFAMVSRMPQQQDQTQRSISICIIICQNFIRENESKSSVSLRDVNRYLIIYEFCSKYFNQNTDAIVLTTYLCYFLRIDSLERRADLNRQLCQKLGWPSDLDFNLGFLRISEEFLADVKNLKVIPKDVSINTPIRENVLATFVAIRNKIPLLICGKPGTSKTLSVGICQRIFNADAALKQNSKYFKDCPVIVTINFWGSQNTTCQSIKEVFKKASMLAVKFKESIPAIIFDEVGLAELSEENPLKVLHPLLEPEECKIAFVGLSNWRLDLSKMNRVLFVSRPDPKLEDYQIMNKGTTQEGSLLEVAIHSLVKTYQDFRVEQEKELKDSHPHFHGARDIYNATTQLKSMFNLLKMQTTELAQLTKFDVNIKTPNEDVPLEQQMHFEQRALEFCLNLVVQRNFSGIEFAAGQCSAQKFKMMLVKILESDFKNWRASQSKLKPKEIQSWIFNEFSDGSKKIQQEYIFKPTQLIFQNLKDESSRHMMILTDDLLVEDVLIEHIKNFSYEIQQKPLDHVVVFRGTESKKQELEIISALPKMITTGYTIILKDLDSIYGCLYDLLNQRYEERNGSKGCYLIYDSHKQWIKIHESFKCVVFMPREDKISKASGIQKKQQPPFLNRFEKYLVQANDIASPREKSIMDLLMVQLYEKKWKTDTVLLHNLSKQLILSLVFDRKHILRNASITNQEGLADILANTFKEFVMYHVSIIKPLKMTESITRDYGSMMMSSYINPNKRSDQVDIDQEKTNALQRLYCLYSKNMILERLVCEAQMEDSNLESFMSFRTQFIQSHPYDSLKGLIACLENPFKQPECHVVFTLTPPLSLGDEDAFGEHTLLCSASDIKKENGKYNIKQFIENKSKEGGKRGIFVLQFCKLKDWKKIAEIREDLQALSQSPEQLLHVILVVHTSAQDFKNSKDLYCYIDFSNTAWRMTTIDNLHGSSYLEFFENLDQTCLQILQSNSLTKSLEPSSVRKPGQLKRAVLNSMSNELRNILSGQFRSNIFAMEITNIITVLEMHEHFMLELLDYILKRAEPEILSVKISDLIQRRASHQQLKFYDCQALVNSIVFDHLRQIIQQGLIAVNDSVGFRFLEIVTLLAKEPEEQRLVLERRWLCSLQKTLQTDTSQVELNFDPMENGQEELGLEFGAGELKGDPVVWYEEIVERFNYSNLVSLLTPTITELGKLGNQPNVSAAQASALRMRVYEKVIESVRKISDHEYEFAMMLSDDTSLLNLEQILVASLCVRSILKSDHKGNLQYSSYSWKLVYHILTEILKESTKKGQARLNFPRICLLAIAVGQCYKIDLKKFNTATTSAPMSAQRIFAQAVSSFTISGNIVFDYSVEFSLDIKNVLGDLKAFKSKEKELRRAILQETQTKKLLEAGNLETPAAQAAEKPTTKPNSLCAKELCLKFMQLVEKKRLAVLERIERNPELIAQLNSSDPSEVIVAVSECFADFVDMYSDKQSKVAVKQTLISMQSIFEQSNSKIVESQLHDFALHFMMIIFRLGEEGINYLTLILLNLAEKFGIPTNIDDLQSPILGCKAAVRQFGEGDGVTECVPYRILLQTLKKFTWKSSGKSALGDSKNKLVHRYVASSDDTILAWRTICRNFLERRTTTPPTRAEVPRLSGNNPTADSGLPALDQMSPAQVCSLLWVPDFETVRQSFLRVHKYLQDYLVGQVPPIDLGILSDLLVLKRMTDYCAVRSSNQPEAIQTINQLVSELSETHLDSPALAIFVRQIFASCDFNTKNLDSLGFTGVSQYLSRHNEGDKSVPDYFVITEIGPNGEAVDQLRACMDDLKSLQQNSQVLEFKFALDSGEGTPMMFWEKYLISFKLLSSSSFLRAMGTGPNSIVERYIKAKVPPTQILQFCADVQLFDMSLEEKLLATQAYLFMEAATQEYGADSIKRIKLAKQFHDQILEATQSLEHNSWAVISALKALVQFSYYQMVKLYKKPDQSDKLLRPNLHGLKGLQSADDKWTIRLLLQYLVRELHNSKIAESQVDRVQVILSKIAGLISDILKRLSVTTLLREDQALCRKHIEANEKILALRGSDFGAFLRSRIVQESKLVPKDDKSIIKDLVRWFTYNASEIKFTTEAIQERFQSLDMHLKSKISRNAISPYLENREKLRQAVELLLKLAEISTELTENSADRLTIEQVHKEARGDETKELIEARHSINRWFRRGNIADYFKALEPHLLTVKPSGVKQPLSSYKQELQYFKNPDSKIPMRLLISGPQTKEDMAGNFLSDLVRHLFKMITQISDLFERPMTLKTYPEISERDLPNLSELQSTRCLLTQCHLISPNEEGFCDEDYLYETIRRKTFGAITALRVSSPFYSFADLKLDKVASQMCELEEKLGFMVSGGETTLESGGSPQKSGRIVRLESGKQSVVSTGANSNSQDQQEHGKSLRSLLMNSHAASLKMYRLFQDQANFEAVQGLDGIFSQLMQLLSNMNPVDPDLALSDLVSSKQALPITASTAVKDFLSRWKVSDLPAIYKAKLAARFDTDPKNIPSQDSRERDSKGFITSLVESIRAFPETPWDCLPSIVLDLKIKTMQAWQMQVGEPIPVNLRSMGLDLDLMTVSTLESALKRASKQELKKYILEDVPMIVRALEEAQRKPDKHESGGGFK